MLLLVVISAPMTTNNSTYTRAQFPISLAKPSPDQVSMVSRNRFQFRQSNAENR